MKNEKKQDVEGQEPVSGHFLLRDMNISNNSKATGRVFKVFESPGMGVTGQPTVDSYKGFNMRYSPVSVMDLVAIVMDEGNPIVYVLEDTREARFEFVRFITDHNDRHGVSRTIAGIYKRTK